MKKLLLKSTLIITTCLLVISCDSENVITPTSTDLEFSLFPPDYFVSYDKVTTLTGGSSTGDQYTIVISEKTQPRTIHQGLNTIPVDFHVRISNHTSGQTFDEQTRAKHFTTDPDDRHYAGDSGLNFTFTYTSVAIPISATIGQSGSIGTYEDINRNTDIINWSLEDGFNGRAKLIISTENRDQFNNHVANEDLSYIIDQSGTVISVSIEIFLVQSGVTISASGS